MRFTPRILSLGTTLALAASSWLLAPSSLSAQTPAAKGPEALAALKAVSDVLKASSVIQFRVQTLREESAGNGEMLMMSYDDRVTAKRPDRLRVTSTGGRSFWYDGKTITMQDTASLYYGSTAAPATIDATVEFIGERLGTSFPQAGVIASDPYAAALDGLESVYIVGLTRVGETDCLQIAGREADADWQLWVTTDDRPLVRRLVVTYKKLPGAPRVISQFSEWRLNANLSPDAFTFVPGPSARKINVELDPANKN